MSYARIKPAMLQIESHPYLTQERLIRLAKDYDMNVTAFSPLGALSYLELEMADKTESVLEQDVVKKSSSCPWQNPCTSSASLGGCNVAMPLSPKHRSLRECAKT